MLLGNYNVFNKNPGHAIGGPTDPTLWLKNGSLNMFYTGDHNVSGETNKSSFNNGYIPPYSWVLAPKAGGLSSCNEINGNGEITGNLAKGINISSTLTGSGSLSAGLSMVVSAVAILTGSGALSAAMTGKVEMAATLAGDGDLSGALGALSNCIATLTGTGSVTANLRGTANLEADITPFTTLSPENLAAAVWNALAADFNNAGTMGEKLNDAGSAGDPWSTSTTTYTDPETFGGFVKKLLTVAKYLGLK